MSGDRSGSWSDPYGENETSRAEDDTCLNQLWEENEVRDICGLAMESVGPREGLGVR